MMENLFSVSGKIALVTGAGQGLGRGYALTLAEAGATVICFDLDAELVQATHKIIQEKAGKSSAIQGDITDLPFVEKMIGDIVSEYGRIDILVNNAGTEYAEDIMDVTEAHFDRIMAVNLKGLYFAAKTAARHMVKQKSGKIINQASLGSFIGLKGSTGYCASKGAVLQYTKALALELAHDNVQVNAIAPGYFRTGMTEPFFQDPAHRKWIEERIPMGRVGVDQDLAGTLLFLSCAASDYITGQTIIVDGGWLAS